MSSFQTLENGQHRTAMPKKGSPLLVAGSPGGGGCKLSKAGLHADTDICSKINKSNPAKYGNSNSFWKSGSYCRSGRLVWHSKINQCNFPHWPCKGKHPLSTSVAAWVAEVIHKGTARPCAWPPPTSTLDSQPYQLPCLAPVRMCHTPVLGELNAYHWDGTLTPLGEVTCKLAPSLHQALLPSLILLGILHCNRQ